MSTGVVNKSHMQNIASAIRNKNGLSTTYTPSEMASAILAIPSGSGTTTMFDTGVMGQISQAFGDASSIGAYKFYGNSNLISASFPNCVNIKNYAFQGCSNLPSVNFPIIQSIGNCAFLECTNISEFTIPSTCYNIGESAFNYNLSNLYIKGYCSETFTRRINFDSIFGIGLSNSNINCNIWIDWASDALTLSAASRYADLITQGTSKNTVVYNIYTNNNYASQAFANMATSYTTINIYPFPEVNI